MKIPNIIIGIPYHIYTVISLIPVIPYWVITGKNYFYSKYYTCVMDWFDKLRGK